MKNEIWIDREIISSAFILRISFQFLFSYLNIDSSFFSEVGSRSL